MSTHLCSARSFDTTSSEAARERIAPHRALWSSPFEEANAREFATDPSGLESSALSRALSTASIVFVLPASDPPPPPPLAPRRREGRTFLGCQLGVRSLSFCSSCSQLRA